MSTRTLAVATPTPNYTAEQRHRIRLRWGYLIFLALLLALAAYGIDYYRMDAAGRACSAKHLLLKPSGSVGLRLGYVGLAMFCVIFLYPLRRRWQWLGQVGNTKHWLDFHILLGLMAPFVIAFHASFKFRGFAGMAFWIMVAVSLSGVVGRYVYGQIPRSLNAAEIFSAELQSQHSRLAQKLTEQKILPAADLQRLLRLPNPERVARMSLLSAVIYMIVLDMIRPLRVARVRRHALGFGQKLVTVGGLRRTKNWKLESAINAARDQASLEKRILFLSRARDVFQLWHMIHRPFSYSFLVLAIIHIVVVTLLGFVR
jgi:hypothetical protein